MATSFPYASGGALAKAFTQFRQSFPPTVNAKTLKRFSIAPNNESYVISVLRFLDLIDEEGKRKDDNINYFYGSDDNFKTGLESALRLSYKALFDDFGDGALEKSRDELIPWFRGTDKSSQTVGSRQAATFTTLAAIAGHGEAPAIPATPNTASGTTPKSRSTTSKSSGTKTTPNNQTHAGPAKIQESQPSDNADFGLTVRIEVNLPAGGDQSTYDAIFKSIRNNLLDRRP